MQLAAVVFDFDGVLADTEPLHLRAYQEALSDLKVTLTREEYYARYLGYDDEGVFRALIGDGYLTIRGVEIPELSSRKARAFERLIGSGEVLFPFAGVAVQRISAVAPLAIASGALGHEIRLVLGATRLLDFFTAIIGAEDAERGKPAPDPYERALEAVSARTGRHIAPARAVAIEDSRWGIQAARAAGMRCIAVTHTYPAADLGDSDLIVSDLASITPESLENLVRS
ncbi:MAG: HAD family phosphatase [Acidobacteria bacterium]|nr:HAD family phosphatase [Acidobacteriota bacterium]